MSLDNNYGNPVMARAETTRGNCRASTSLRAN